MTAAPSSRRPGGRRSPAPTSAGRQGSRSPTEPAGPMFDDDLWDFTDVAGIPVSMGRISAVSASRRSPTLDGGWPPRS